MFNILEKIYAAKPSADEISQATQIDLNKYGNFTNVFIKILDLMLWFAGVLIFIYLLIAGIQYITAGGNPEQVKKGQQGIINAIIGIIIVVLSLAIVRVISNMFNSK
ncbi:MAG: hypothetical protein M1324_02610 [Patescibacteria group bacterium]|nr:hypothetical protein [Patescibacteria group bacterium]